MPIKPSKLLAIAFACLVLLGPGRQPCAQGEEFIQSFEEPETGWRLRFDESKAQLVEHRRHETIHIDGARSEYILFEPKQQGAAVQFTFNLPPSRVIDELRLELSIQANCPGALLYLRVVFPHQQNPRTGEALMVSVVGDNYTDVGKWQKLACADFQDQIAKQLVSLRADLKEPNLNTKDAYVDRAFVMATLDRSAVEFFLDDLHFGPLVKLDGDNAEILPARSTEPARPLPIEFRLDRPMVNNRPFFPRIVSHHGEAASTLKEAGFNVVWIPDYQDDALLNELSLQGLHATATPPRAVSPTGEVLVSQEAGLVPFTDASSEILFWYLGTGISGDEKKDLMAWIGQVRSADRTYRRPIVADVNELEGVYSRNLDLMSLSRHIINTSFSPKQYKDWLQQRRRLARPGTMLLTWVATEAATPNSAWRAELGKTSIVFEPEQIRQQVYAALSSGFRGVGYWTTTPLDGDAPGAYERMLQISLLNLELEMFEPWLATGKLETHVPFSLQGRNVTPIDQKRLDALSATSNKRQFNALLTARDEQKRQEEQIYSELEAAIIGSDYGKLVLPVWYQHDAQFVPGQMAGYDAKIVVPGDQTSHAWVVTTTEIYSPPTQRVAGGLEVTIKKFNQTAAVILTSSDEVVRELRRKANSLAERSARLSIELAKAKLVRVRAVDAELESLGVGQADAPQILTSVDIAIQNAENQFDLTEYSHARESSEEAMQLLRILQRAHWVTAVRVRGSAVSSPYTVCFQTLPDHWRLIPRIGRSPMSVDGNLLPAGDFESIDAMKKPLWQHEQKRIDGVEAAAELYESPHDGELALRLTAHTVGEDAPSIMPRSPVSVSTPPLPASKGQIMYISGWIKLAGPPGGSLDGVMVYDSLTGPVGALRFTKGCDWEPFELIREVQQTGEFEVTFSLTGTGEVYFDDIQVVPHTPPAEDGAIVPASNDGTPKRSRTRDLLNRVRGMRQSPQQR